MHITFLLTAVLTAGPFNVNELRAKDVLYVTPVTLENCEASERKLSTKYDKLLLKVFIKQDGKLVENRILCSVLLTDYTKVDL